MGRIERLREAHLILEQSKQRMVKNLSIWDHADHSGEPIVVRKAHGLALLLEESPAIIMENELIIGLRTIYGLRARGYNELPVNPATRHSLITYPRYLTDEERARERAETAFRTLYRIACDAFPLMFSLFYSESPLIVVYGL